MLYSMLKKFAYKGNIGSDGFILYMRSELHDLFIPANQTKEPMSTDDKQWQYLQWDPKWMTINIIIHRSLTLEPFASNAINIQLLNTFSLVKLTLLSQLTCSGNDTEAI